RLIAFVAKTRVMAGGDPAAIGLGVDEGAAIAVDAQGQGKLYGPAGTYAWLVEPQGKPTTIAANTPLDQAGIRITALGR
ncbi:hypothetical protein ACE4Z6_28050, partial [Salmonella enterica]|uniref:hypothetical protein n=1 Tax=Salmonella enterica TaxID=28901 RepID=UPI003D26999D